MEACMEPKLERSTYDSVGKTKGKTKGDVAALLL